jgi:hypothetical protein
MTRLLNQRRERVAVFSSRKFKPLRENRIPVWRCDDGGVP